MKNEDVFSAIHKKCLLTSKKTSKLTTKWSVEIAIVASMQKQRKNMNKKIKNIDKVKEILKNNHNVKYAFLFGSIIKRPLPESDVDILMGGVLDFSERTDLALEIELILKRKVDIVLVNQAAPELVLKAFSLGVALFAREKKELKEDYFRNLRLCEDRKNLQRLKIARLKRRS